MKNLALITALFLSFSACAVQNTAPMKSPREISIIQSERMDEIIVGMCKQGAYMIHMTHQLMNSGVSKKIIIGNILNNERMDAHQAKIASNIINYVYDDITAKTMTSDEYGMKYYTSCVNDDSKEFRILNHGM